MIQLNNEYDFIRETLKEMALSAYDDDIIFKVMNEAAS